MTKGLATKDGIDRQKWQRPFTKGKYLVGELWTCKSGESWTQQNHTYGLSPLIGWG